MSSQPSEADRPKIGVGVIIHDRRGNIIMGQRTTSPGKGTLQLPGGHLEHSETFASCAVRETREETGLEVADVRFLTATNTVFPPEEGEQRGKHYVTVFVTAVVSEGSERKAPVNMEPNKCDGWEWVAWRDMWDWAGEHIAEREGE
ncbi:hypothetical protein BU24DRAFT_447815, partial [Aaosphaeria arxii CBS 175.79]